jgi:hypothetical protein
MTPFETERAQKLKAWNMATRTKAMLKQRVRELIVHEIVNLPF